MGKLSGLLRYGVEPIHYEILHSPRRRTVSIEVHRDLRVLVRVPARYSHEAVVAWVGHRARWIARQLERFRRHGPLAPPLRYVSGEAHSYLGSQYPLEVVHGVTDGVELADGHIVVSSAAGPDSVRALLHAWYFGQASTVFHAVLRKRHAAFFEGRGHALPALVLKTMRRRWGSMSPRGRMCLNVDLIRAPLACIELVVAHELCHLEHPDHGARFYGLLAQAMPDWKEARAALRTGRWILGD